MEYGFYDNRKSIIHNTDGRILTCSSLSPAEAVSKAIR